jgi:hypothetical protein
MFQPKSCSTMLHISRGYISWPRLQAGWETDALLKAISEENPLANSSTRIRIGAIYRNLQANQVILHGGQGGEQEQGEGVRRETRAVWGGKWRG